MPDVRQLPVPPTGQHEGEAAEEEGGVEKPPRLIIRLLFGFAYDSVFSFSQTQQKYQQILRRQSAMLS